ncbi:hypothetical protein [Parasphingorhabdus sp.]|uniref:hypothetical protein n=1 Tax=Parasphingorhabdus sp. TaxID=2709688 RepID=UPI00359316C9
MSTLTSLAILLSVSTSTQHAAPEISEPVKEGLSESARNGNLRVLQLWSTDSARFLREWAQPTPPNLTIDSKVRRNKPIEQFIIIGGCQANVAGNCDLSGVTTMTDPAGEVYGETLTFKAWDNLPKPSGNVLSLSPMGTGLRVEDGEKLGTYRIRLSITDNVAKITATTEVEILVVEAQE